MNGIGNHHEPTLYKLSPQKLHVSSLYYQELLSITLINSKPIAVN